MTYFNVKPTCSRSDCFACHDGECHILTDLTKRQPCPFYKTAEQFKHDKEAADIKNQQAALAFKAAMLQLNTKPAAHGTDKHRGNRVDEES